MAPGQQLPRRFTPVAGQKRQQAVVRAVHVISRKKQQEIEKQAADDVAKTVKDINQRVSGWLYAIQKNKYDTMVSKPEDLLKPLEQS